MKTSLAAALIGISLTAATANAAPASTPAEKYDASWHSRQQLYILELKPEDGWQWAQGGMRYRRVKGDGSGAHPTVANSVKIHYVGRFIDGKEFDSSIARGAPAVFPLARLIQGWQIGVPLMGVGDTFEFAIPARLAYGLKGRPDMPGNATLLFTVELLGIEG